MKDQYDPNAVEDKPKSKHISKRDLIFVSIIVFMLLLFGYPVVINMLSARHKHVCKTHLGSISMAVLVYAEQNNDRLPPVYAMEEKGYAPYAKGKVVNSWVSLLAPFVNKPAEEFQCPAAKANENVTNEGPKGTTIESSYGMFGGLSAMPLGDIPDQGGVVMMAETANLGAQSTFDPEPMIGADDKSRPDGILIGFDNSNFYPSDENNVFAVSKWASRLAFYGTNKGEFLIDKFGRHGAAIHFVFPDRHIETLPATMAQIQRFQKDKGEIIKLWAFR